MKSILKTVKELKTTYDVLNYTESVISKIKEAEFIKDILGVNNDLRKWQRLEIFANKIAIKKAKSPEEFEACATYNEKTGVTTYTGNVIIEQGTMKLQANSIVANLNSQKEISTITATGGPARFQQKVDVNKGLAKGQAQKILYNAQTGIVTFSGSALLEQDGASIRGNTLKYSMNKGDIEATGTPNSTGSSSGRVQIVIPPSSSKSFPGARD